ncbi:MAG: zinc ABC transporter substrate-binding protein [Gemmataceae bacterium]|nr:zinc ABC transporter substrate-binding protein [Gemmataceae bacterium]
MSLTACSKAPDPFANVKPEQLRILASFAPLYCFAANVVGEHGKVLCLLSSKGVHDYTAVPFDSIKVAKADVFFVNGLGVDDFAARLVSAARARSDVLFDVGAAIPEEQLIHLDADQRVHYHADGSKCEHGEHDPHIWLGPKQAELMVLAMARRLGELRPALKDEFDKNAAAYIDQLRALHRYGKEKLGAKKNRRVIVTHDFLRYFAREYDVEVVGVIQPKPGQEAVAGQLARLCREKDVHVIIIEPQYSRAGAESLQREFAAKGIAVRLAEIDPMETASVDADGNPDPGLYLRRMRENIDNLAQALP